MEDKIIKINIDKTLNRISGNDFGKEIYVNQVKPVLKYPLAQQYVIVFPEEIRRVGGSFVQGFKKEIIENIGDVNLFYNYIKIEGSEKFKNDFRAGVFS